MFLFKHDLWGLITIEGVFQNQVQILLTTLKMRENVLVSFLHLPLTVVLHDQMKCLSWILLLLTKQLWIGPLERVLGA